MLLWAALVLAGAPLHAAPNAPAPCVTKSRSVWREPATLDALLDCQARRRGDWIAAYQDEQGSEPPASALDQLDAFQRKEAASYAARHPDRAQAGGDQSPSAGSDGAFAAQQRRTAAAMQDNDQKVDPGTARDLDALNASLASSSRNGTLGITPDGAKSIVDYLSKQQGGVSPDMQALLDSLSHDGGKLSDKSMVELKQAARTAKDAGLDLGVDDKLQTWLLDPTTDPEKPQPGAD